VRRAILATLAATLLLGAAPLTTPKTERCEPTVYPAAGTYDAQSARHGPGLVLSGAGGGELMPAAALTWMRAHIGASRSGRAGNVVILRASGERDNTDRFYHDGNFAWVEEVLIPPCASRAQVDGVAAIVARADAVFFAGGDQSHYAAWKGSALIDAVRDVYARGGIVGGGSAGLAIQGQLGYDSVAANRLHPHDDDFTVHSDAALRNPLEGELSFTHLFDWPALDHTITDSHFAARDRFGRLVAFLARVAFVGTRRAPLYGLGIDEGSVVLVEPDGTAILRTLHGSHGAYLVRLSAQVALAPGQPLRTHVDLIHIAGDGTRFDLLHKMPGHVWRSIGVDGAAKPPYADPYK
jgi:cyanophycinase